ncbi:MAG: recombinase family protein [Acholeplasmataceae bacterium]|jgi:DNA invertase Pin-like site-specific DNA recombinase|nr:recombinase family protein [Acholeplasmataceae bacterium]
MAKVRVIPSTINPVTLTPLGQLNRRKVAAYARVSTDDEEQATSYETQVKHYTEFIQKKPEWEFVKVYADDGISGTSTKRREGFNEMIKDALDGKIDLIITKSISRFARNTLDTISYTRKLKTKGIEVYFEKENLWSLDDKTEFLLTIMASMAQEESRSISQNVTMGKRWGMKEGRVSWAYSNMLGYKKENGKIVVVENEAILVRQIYQLFLREGKTCTGIAEYLKAQGIPTPSGKSYKWTKNTINSILRNEKYKGDALLQKTYTTDYLEHRVEKNRGHLPQYYVENSHPAIIDKEEWEIVQAELLRREKIGASYSGNSVFSSKLICSDCGGYYGRKIWHSTSKYARSVYQCNCKYSKKHNKCQTAALSEDTIKEKFVNAYNQVMKRKPRIIEDIHAIIQLLEDTSKLDEKIIELQNNMEVISGLVDKMIKENARTAQDQLEFNKRYEELSSQYEENKIELDKTLEQRAYKQAQEIKMKAYLAEIKNADNCLPEWSNDMWMIMVEKAIVNRDKTITFKFTSGTEITV